MSLPYLVFPGGLSGWIAGRSLTSVNGRLPANLLSHVSGVGDFQVQAARSLRALKAHAARDGIVVASVGDYRSYDEQVALFLTRYVPAFVPGVTQPGTQKVWQGKTYWLLNGAAGAAVPGTSNHGWGLANDMAQVVNGKVVSLSLDAPGPGPSLWDWLRLVGRLYGWSWGEATSEAWHWVYIEGDRIPAAVLAFEHPSPPPPPRPSGVPIVPLTAADASMVWNGIQLPSQLEPGKTYTPAEFLVYTHAFAVRGHNHAAEAHTDTAAMRPQLDAVKVEVDALTAKIDAIVSGGGTPDTAALVATIRTIVREEVRAQLDETRLESIPGQLEAVTPE